MTSVTPVRLVTFPEATPPEGDGARHSSVVSAAAGVAWREERLRRAQKLEALGQLAGGVAHDFNNLLSIIRGYVELAAAGRPHPELDEALAATDRAARLVQQLFAFAHPDSPRSAAVAPARVVHAVHQMVAPLLGPDVDLVSQTAPGLPPVALDATLLEQAVVNLVVNARDALPCGGTITVTADAPAEDDLPTGLAGHYVRFAVTDTGTGMAPDVAERAYEPFFTTKGGSDGTGLGLASVCHTTSQAGGTVTLSSAPGRGTCVELFLPVAPEQHSPAETSPLT